MCVMKNGCTALVGPTAKGRRCRRKRGEAEQDGPHLALRPERNPGSFEGRQDLQTKVMTTLFALFAEVERVSVSDAPRKVWPRPKLARAARAPMRSTGRQGSTGGTTRSGGCSTSARTSAPRRGAPESLELPSAPSEGREASRSVNGRKFRVRQRGCQNPSIAADKARPVHVVAESEDRR